MCCARTSLGVISLLLAHGSILGCNRDGAVPRDLGRADLALDAGGHGLADLAGCNNTHSLKQPVPLDSITAIDPSAQAGSVVRVLVTYRLRDCDAAADIQATVTSGNATDFATLTAMVWKADVDTAACATSRMIRRAVLLPLLGNPNPTVSIHDGGGGKAVLTLSVAARPGADCQKLVAAGEKCQLDCQCQGTYTALHCLGIQSGSGTCAVPCSVDGECVLQPRTLCDTQGLMGSPAFTCATPSDACACDASRCLPRQGCGRPDNPACRCLPVGQSTFGGGCACDADCAPGGLCDPRSGCFTPCTTIGDCPPEGLICDGRCFWGI